MDGTPEPFYELFAKAEKSGDPVTQKAHDMNLSELWTTATSSICPGNDNQNDGKFAGLKPKNKEIVDKAKWGMLLKRRTKNEIKTRCALVATVGV